MCYIYPKMKKIVSNKLRSHLTANQKDHLENNFQIPIYFFCFPFPFLIQELNKLCHDHIFLWVFTAKVVVEN